MKKIQAAVDSRMYRVNLPKMEDDIQSWSKERLVKALQEERELYQDLVKQNTETLVTKAKLAAELFELKSKYAALENAHSEFKASQPPKTPPTPNWGSQPAIKGRMDVR